MVKKNIKVGPEKGRAAFLRAQAEYESGNEIIAPKHKIVFPQSFVERVAKIDSRKKYDFCFMGAFAFWDKFKVFKKKTQERGFSNRKWVIDFARSNFGKNSIFINTSKNLNLAGKEWVNLGAFDETFSEKGSLPKIMKNKGEFDFYYYSVMKQSKFALCPAGDAPWSIRFFEALMCKAIPVVKNHSETWRLLEERDAGYIYYLADDLRGYSHSAARHNYELFIKHHTVHTYKE